jgi:hypothetical protein
MPTEKTLQRRAQKENFVIQHKEQIELLMKTGYVRKNPEIRKFMEEVAIPALDYKGQMFWQDAWHILHRCYLKLKKEDKLNG